MENIQYRVAMRRRMAGRRDGGPGQRPDPL